jgi:NADP-dependent 3-hydroxy acid dehydrogenase YdfG
MGTATKRRSTSADEKKPSLANATALITGGTTGIGRATAIALADAGARVLIFGRDRQHLNDALKDLKPYGDRANGLTADVAEPKDIARVFAEVDRQFEHLDILVNNAALSADDILDGEYSHWDYIIRTNLTGYFACAHEAFERMRAAKAGHIVNVGSISADMRNAGSSLYVATKSAVQGFSYSLRKEGQKYGIRVTLVEPGTVGSDMQPDSPAQQRTKERNMKMLKAEDIADAIVYCLNLPRRCVISSMQVEPLQQEY